jgi:rhodanese-related sulfurtransferase
MIAFLPRLFRRFRTREPACIDCAELQPRLATGSVTLVDVRQPEEFSAPPGHLPGALNMPLAEVGRHSAELADRKSSIVVVCKTDRRSANCPRRASRMSVCCAAAPMPGIAKDCRWSS